MNRRTYGGITWMQSSMYEAVTIDALLEALKELPQNAFVTRGFANPHSYRGYYEELGVEPAESTIQHMVDVLEDALGTVYEGYKGGDFLMSGHTGVHFATYGNTGHPITPDWVELITREVDNDS